MADFALSPQQRTTWLWSQANPVPDARCLIRIDGELRLRELRGALASVVARHGILRTSFVRNDPAAEPRQVVAAEGVYSLLVVDARACPGASLQLWNRCADPEPEPGSDAVPVLRAILVRQERHRHSLILRLPALCADARSLLNLVSEIADGYGRQAAVGSSEAGSEVTQYGRFAQWQNALMEEDARAGDWQPEQAAAQQAGSPLLPFTGAPGTRGRTGYDTQSAELPPAVVARIDAIVTRSPVTFTEFLLSCWQVLLWQQTRSPVMVVGLVTDGRVYEELAPVVGACAKVLPVMICLAENDRLADVLGTVKRAVDEAMQGQEYFNWADELVAAQMPAWVFESVQLTPALTADGIVFTVQDLVAGTGPFAVKLGCRRSAERVTIVLEHDRGRLDGTMIACLLEQLMALAAEAAANPSAPIGALSAVSAAQEQRLIVDFNRTATEFPHGRCAHQLFEEQAAATPDRIAVTTGSQSMSYRELNASSNRLARHLRALGAGPEVAVGICLERTADMIAAVLAVHKAGAAYVPIDPLHPGDRVRTIIDDTRMPIMISDARSAARLPAGGSPTVMLERDRDVIGARASANLDVRIYPGQLAYVLHTSGSTGRPKGVQVSHEALANFLRSMRQVPGIGPRDTIVAVTTLSFDIAALELYLPLTVGARVTMASRQTAADPRALGRLLTDSAATVFQATPVTWRMLVSSGWPGAPTLTALIGGEALSPELAARVAPRVGRLWNMYGPTETTIWSTCAEIRSDHCAISVGGPIANTCAHVLDPDLRPVAIGMVGELCIGGTGVARGYVGRPDLTAERFVPDPFGCQPGGRMYRTGDLARYDQAGRLYVLGRTDSQVKIRGFRVELGEIETALARHPAVRAAAAAARREQSGEMRVDGYLVLEPGVQVEVAEVRHFVTGRLPPVMVPARLAVVESLPLTANGKVDRAKLPEISAGNPAPARHVPTGTRLEHAIARVWRAVLDVEQPGMTDNFFDLGGHSVLLAQVSGLLSQDLGREVTQLMILEHPTIASLASHLEAGDDTPPPDQDAAPVLAGRDRLLRRRSKARNS
jgi:amino acid adenylation domain-containing protein